MIDDHVTTREFDNAIAGMRDMIVEGFRGVNSRLDITNGRIGKHDDDINNLRDRQQEHQRQTDAANVVFMHRRADDPPPMAVNPDNEPITYKDLKRAMLVAAAVMAIAGGVVLTILLKAVAK